MVSPAQFITPIETMGLADALCTSITRQVLSDMQRWRRASNHFKASINLSMDCAHDLELPQKLDEMAREFEVPPDQLIMEITESRLMADKALVLETLTRLSIKGFELSIDDFGTGYSSLSQLAALPFSELKVDRSFVNNASSDNKSMAILQSTLTIARSLGMEVVAEGVETFDQLDILRALADVTIQGFLVARPMPAQQLEKWLSDWRPGLVSSPGCDRRFSLLVVDDSESMRMVIKAEFAQRLRNARIFEAEDGEQAIEIIKNNSIDAASVDFHMPGLHGIELLKQLRNFSPATRFMMLTADLSERIARESVANGALYMHKPLNTHQLERAIRYFLEI